MRFRGNMDFFETQHFFSKLYPEKEIKYEFDDKCIRFIEMSFEEGLPFLLHHIEYRKVKVLVEGMEEIYTSISPHRMAIPISELKKYISSFEDCFINQEDLSNLKSLEGKDERKDLLKSLEEWSGLSEEQILSKLK